ncbi:MAG: ribosome silencing factor [Firmicutes bacterium]|nr:ribosome silencing factor [Bacillota bacterium]
MNSTIKERCDGMCAILDFHKGRDIAVVDLSGQTVVADCFIIAHGATVQQVKAMADYLDEEMAKTGLCPIRTEGYTDGRWVVLDYGDIIVHLFRKEEREYFSLERLWENGGNIVYYAK